MGAVTTNFTLTASYGYTYATFKDYITTNSKLEEISYNGNYVPFVPKHTLSPGGQYIFRINPDIGWTVFNLMPTTPVQDVSIGLSRMMSAKLSTAH